jgi:hypothetical protein
MNAAALFHERSGGVTKVGIEEAEMIISCRFLACMGVVLACIAVPVRAHEPNAHSRYNQMNDEWFRGTQSSLGGCCGVSDAYVFRESYALGRIDEGMRAEVVAFTKCDRVDDGFRVEVWDILAQQYVERVVHPDAFIRQRNLIGKYVVWVDYDDGKTLRIKCLALEIEA